MGLNYSNAMGNAPYYAVISKTLGNMNGIESPLDIPSEIHSRTDAMMRDPMSSLYPQDTARFTDRDMAKTYHLSKDVLGAYMSGIGSLADADA